MAAVSPALSTNSTSCAQRLTPKVRLTDFHYSTANPAQIVHHSQKSIREKLDRLDQAFLFERSIDIETYDRHRDKLREELTLAQMDRHSCELEEMDVEGIVAFAERVLPSASNLWVQSSLAQKQRLQQLLFPEGVRFDGRRLVGTGTTLPVFNYLSSVSEQKKDLVDQTGIEPVTS